MYKPESERGCLSQNLKLFCSENNLTYEAAAAVIGVRKSAFMNWIGQRSLPVDEDKKALEKVFGASYKMICSSAVSANLLLNHVYCAEDIYPFNVIIAATIDFRYAGTNAVEDYETHDDIELPSAYRKLTLEEIENIISAALGERELLVIRSRYQNSETLDAVGRLLGVTKERVRQIEMKSLRKIRQGVYQTLRTKETDRRTMTDLLDTNIALQNQVNELMHIPPKDPLMDIPIEALDFDIRAYNCLKRADYETVYDIVTSVADLSRIRNLGVRTLDNIIATISKLHINYKYDEQLHHFVPIVP